MNLRYKNKKYHYNINCSSIRFYSFWEDSLPRGYYKNNWFGLDLWRKIITNYPSGIKINDGDDGFEV